MDFWAVTDKGIVRSQNQDSFYTSCDDVSGASVLLVCDGMGGAKAGNVASELAEKVFVSELGKYTLSELTDAKLEKAMKEAFDTANTAVFELSNTDPDCSGMGTTMVAAVVVNGKAVVGNVGDSRAYRITESDITQITRDHSVVEDMIRRGEITREASRTHPNKNLITRAVGTGPDVMTDFFDVMLSENERILLCSDGLSNIVKDEEIQKTVTGSENAKAACDNLLKLALERNAPDNVTVAILKI